MKALVSGSKRRAKITIWLVYLRKVFGITKYVAPKNCLENSCLLHEKHFVIDGILLPDIGFEFVLDLFQTIY